MGKIWTPKTDASKLGHTTLRVGGISQSLHLLCCLERVLPATRLALWLGSRLSRGQMQAGKAASRRLSSAGQGCQPACSLLGLLLGLGAGAEPAAINRRLAGAPHLTHAGRVLRGGWAAKRRGGVQADRRARLCRGHAG